MITKELKISKMLNAYPQTLEVLLETSSHFNLLNYRVLRKTLVSRVTIEQGAMISGVNLAQPSLTSQCRFFLVPSFQSIYQCATE
ncbi:MAG: DUF1858 domain-containing protein [Bacteroidetes bacterium]|nr:DUF1858 domain-containing protein [Bacteroidota bacterium]